MRVRALDVIFLIFCAWCFLFSAIFASRSLKYSVMREHSNVQYQKILRNSDEK